MGHEVVEPILPRLFPLEKRGVEVEPGVHRSFQEPMHRVTRVFSAPEERRRILPRVFLRPGIAHDVVALVREVIGLELEPPRKPRVAREVPRGVKRVRREDGGDRVRRRLEVNRIRKLGVRCVKLHVHDLRRVLWRQRFKAIGRGEHQRFFLRILDFTRRLPDFRCHLVLQRSGGEWRLGFQPLVKRFERFIHIRSLERLAPWQPEELGPDGYVEIPLELLLRAVGENRKNEERARPGRRHIGEAVEFVILFRVRFTLPVLIRIEECLPVTLPIPEKRYRLFPMQSVAQIARVRKEHNRVFKAFRRVDRHDPHERFITLHPDLAPVRSGRLRFRTIHPLDFKVIPAKQPLEIPDPFVRRVKQLRDMEPVRDAPFAPGPPEILPHGLKH
ncbi:unknown [Sutterella sp. CAG:351]|nr:unknown [Sutterella sp. CAG:351]